MSLVDKLVVRLENLFFLLLLLLLQIIPCLTLLNSGSVSVIVAKSYYDSLLMDGKHRECVLLIYKGRLKKTSYGYLTTVKVCH